MSHTAIIKSFVASDVPKNWKQEASVYTGDHLIDAYLRGKKDGGDEYRKILIKQFRTNIEIAAKVAEQLLSEATATNIEIKSIRLRAEGIFKFSALFVANANDYLTDEFRNLLIASRRLKAEVQSESFYISFSFIPFTESLNEKAIYSDGYFLTYDKR